MLKEERLRDEQEFEFNLERDEMIQLHQAFILTSISERHSTDISVRAYIRTSRT
jgi:hypothetical protein